MHSPSPHHSNALPAGYPPAQPGPQAVPAPGVYVVQAPSGGSHAQPDASPPRTRVRWGRVIGAFILVAGGAFLLTTQLGGRQSATVTSSSAAEIKQVPATTVAPKAKAPATKPPAAKPPKAKAPATKGPTSTAPRPSGTGAGDAGTPVRGGGVNGATVVANRRTTSGEQLPFTGLPVWMAALGGLMLIAAGLWMQRNALDIGTAAGGYRRGPALRPVATARLLVAQIR